MSNFHRKFKLIDFGFAEIYPFKNYLKLIWNCWLCSQKYQNVELHDCAYLPDKNPNDWYNGKHLSIVYPNNLNYSLYKMTLMLLVEHFYLNYRLEEYFSNNINKKSTCFCLKKVNNYKSKNKNLKDLINQLIHNDIYFRLLPQHCLRLRFFIS